MTKIDEKNIFIPPKASVGDTNFYLNGIAKFKNKVVLLLDITKIVNHEAISEIAQNNI